MHNSYLSIVPHVCNPNTQEPEAGDYDFGANLGFISSACVTQTSETFKHISYRQRPKKNEKGKMQSQEHRLQR